MKRVGFVAGLMLPLALAACSPSEESKAAAAVEPAPTMSSSAPAAEAAPAPAGAISTNYLDAAAALSVDDFAKAKTSLAALAAESTGDFQAKAQAAADAKDVAAMREAFKPLSETASAMELPADYAVALCPMFKGGAKWVQKRGEIKNPYFGNSMQTCGTFVN